MSQTHHLAIGNTDDKLSQAEWHDFHAETDHMVRSYAIAVHGHWVSPSTDPYQNACWAFDLHADEDPVLFRRRLSRLAAKWEQDSIALNSSQTEFVKPDYLRLAREQVPEP